MSPVINEDVVAASLLYFYRVNDEESEQHDMVINIDFEAVFSAGKSDFFHQCII